MLNSLSLRKKILLLIGGTISLLLIISAFFLVNHIAKLSRSSIEAEAASYLSNEKLNIESYFLRYGSVVETFVTNPHLVNWFSDWTEREGNHKAATGYNEVNQDFLRISGNDDNILSAFFASANTGEYFKENERTSNYNGAPYYAYKRPWWQTALGYNSLYVGPLSVDLTTGNVSAVVQQPVYNASGKLVGVGGVDLRLNNMADLIEKIQFHGEGYGFLLDSEQKVVHLSKATGHSLSIVDDEKTGKKKDDLSSLEQQMKDSTGFSTLNSLMKNNLSGTHTVTLKGKEYFVVFQRLQLDKPKLDWYLGLLVPQSYIQKPVEAAVWSTISAVMVILAIVIAMIFWATHLIAKPIIVLTNAMQDIASGDGDLTKRIEIESRDEVGQLAMHVNTFIEKLRVILLEAKDQSLKLDQASADLSRVSEETNQEIMQEKEQVDSVSTAVTEMAATVLEISRNAQAANTAAEQVQHLTNKATSLSTGAQQAMADLSEHIDNASEVVSGLAHESSNIGAVVDVINGIAEQTNLLALNAAIEAARAGEQGRGFAVVADEVRSLASRTQESTDDIRNMIVKLQQIANKASTMMQQGKEQAEHSHSQTKDVLKAFDEITYSVQLVQDQNHQIATATEEQTVVAEDINASLSLINNLVNNTSLHANDLSQEAQELSELASELSNTVSTFKL